MFWNCEALQLLPGSLGTLTLQMSPPGTQLPYFERNKPHGRSHKRALVDSPAELSQLTASL